jgi:hypothetical protein
MKKTSFILISIYAFLNTAQAQSSFGIAAGATFASYKATIETISITSKTKTGFTVGVVSSFPMGKSFSFQPNLNFLQKGGTLKADGSTDKTTLNYLELPLNFVYNTHSSKGKFFIGAGPSLSFGLSGKDKFEEGSSKIKFGSDQEDDFKPFEIGINVLAGYQLKNGFFIDANYNAGLNDIANVSDGFEGKYHNRFLV